ncbi:uncharacterized protein [Centruroides vittatus]|uniref:uncharacterized protein isoform X2 n=1 Tax=Centruroides vittatus TaxID=120091 RepID=UPI0035107418
MDPTEWAPYGQHFTRIGTSSMTHSTEMKESHLSPAVQHQDFIGGFTETTDLLSPHTQDYISNIPSAGQYISNCEPASFPSYQCPSKMYSHVSEYSRSSDFYRSCGDINLKNEIIHNPISGNNLNIAKNPVKNSNMLSVSNQLNLSDITSKCGPFGMLPHETVASEYSEMKLTAENIEKPQNISYMDQNIVSNQCSVLTSTHSSYIDPSESLSSQNIHDHSLVTDSITCLELEPPCDNSILSQTMYRQVLYNMDENNIKQDTRITESINNYPTHRNENLIHTKHKERHMNTNSVICYNPQRSIPVNNTREVNFTEERILTNLSEPVIKETSTQFSPIHISNTQASSYSLMSTSIPPSTPAHSVTPISVVQTHIQNSFYQNHGDPCYTSVIKDPHSIMDVRVPPVHFQGESTDYLYSYRIPPHEGNFQESQYIDTAQYPLSETELNQNKYSTFNSLLCCETKENMRSNEITVNNQTNINTQSNINNENNRTSYHDWNYEESQVIVENKFETNSSHRKKDKKKRGRKKKKRNIYLDDNDEHFSSPKSQKSYNVKGITLKLKLSKQSEDSSKQGLQWQVTINDGISKENVTHKSKYLDVFQTVSNTKENIFDKKSYLHSTSDTDKSDIVNQNEVNIVKELNNSSKEYCNVASSKHQSKKYLPSIEEDLGFLANLPLPEDGTKNKIKKKKTKENCGFFDSFLKFIKGDSANYAAKHKTDNERVQKQCNLLDVKKESISSSQILSNVKIEDQMITNILNSTVEIRLSKCDMFNDNAIFMPPITKEESKNFGGGKICINKKIKESKANYIAGGSNRGRGRKVISTDDVSENDVESKRPHLSSEQVTENSDEKDNNLSDDCEDIPLDSTSSDSGYRRTSMRKCKEQTLQKRQESLRQREKDKLLGTEIESAFSSDDDDDDGEQMDDSDLDPVWTPADKVESSKQLQNEEISKRRSFRGSNNRTPAKTKITNSPSYEPKPSLKDFTLDSKETPAPVTEVKVTYERKIKSPTSFKFTQSTRIIEGHFKPGNFVLAIADKDKENPPIWRIEGKSLLQRFEPFNADGRILYRNASSYSAWNSTTIYKYIGVNVILVTHNRVSSIVEKLGPIAPEEQEGEKTSQSSQDQQLWICTYPGNNHSDQGNGNEDTSEDSTVHPQQENFEVYLQTLISQVLDPNFITEITKENDEYFLSHMKEIEDMSEERKKKIFQNNKFPDEIKTAVETFPRLEILPNNESEDNCQVCNEVKSQHTLQYRGMPYDPSSLESKELSSEEQSLSLKKILVCGPCAQAAVLYSHLHHHKYNFYFKCKKKVQDVKNSMENKESHMLLEECLQDAAWVNQMFQEIKDMWAKGDKTR